MGTWGWWEGHLVHRLSLRSRVRGSREWWNASLVVIRSLKHDSRPAQSLPSTTPPFRMCYRTLSYRRVGANNSPATIALWITTRICRFAQLCDIGPIDFFRFWHVVSTTQGDLGHVVRSSVGCLGSEIFCVMCVLFFRRKALFWAQISIFDPKILRFSFFRCAKEREFRVP